MNNPNIKIPFNKSYKLENLNLIESDKLSGDGRFTFQSQEFMNTHFGLKHSLLTTSCTTAIEMIAILLEIQIGDEIIAPSFTFVSSVNPFVSRGAKVKFIDIRPDTLNIDETLIEAAISDKTKAIIVVHYAGVICDMDRIIEIGKKYNIYIIEDAAHAIGSTYKNQFAGTFGALSVFSFHETKNFSMGEGGALILNDVSFLSRAEIIREKGTNRKSFLKGEIDKYTWVDIGGSYLPSDINALYLMKQFEIYDIIKSKRISLWNLYYKLLISLDKHFDLPKIPINIKHNAHIFFIILKSELVREKLRLFLISNGILAISHYVPLHSSPAGIIHGEFVGEDIHTTGLSNRLLRLPMYYDLEEIEVRYICDKINYFFNVDTN